MELSERREVIEGIFAAFDRQPRKQTVDFVVNRTNNIPLPGLISACDAIIHQEDFPRNITQAIFNARFAEEKNQGYDNEVKDLCVGCECEKFKSNGCGITKHIRVCFQQLVNAQFMVCFRMAQDLVRERQEYYFTERMQITEGMFGPEALHQQLENYRAIEQDIQRELTAHQSVT